MGETERVRGLWERNAARYDNQISFWEKRLFKDGRSWVCERARGDVLEIAAGTGRNFPFYGDDVRVVATEFSPAMLDIARSRAGSLDRSIRLEIADAQSLSFSDASFDCVVCTLALCNIPDEGAAVREAFRVLRPGGSMLLLEHVASDRVWIRVIQRAMEPFARRFEGDHLLRDPEPHLKAAGFTVEELERYGRGIVKRLVARKPA